MNDRLRSGTRAIARGRAQSLLVGGQLAASTMLLVVAMLLIQSLRNLHQQRLGFDPSSAVTFWTAPISGGERGNVEFRAFEATLLDRLRGLPGVRTAGAASVIPLDGQNNYPVERLGHPEQSGGIQVRVVTAGFFETMRMPMRDGRSFSSNDAHGGPPAIVVNEALARRWWPGTRPLGDHLVLGRVNGKDLGEIAETPRQVIGVVGDTKTEFLGEPPRPTIYVLLEQTAWYTGGMNWVVRGDNTTQLGPRLRDVVAEIDSRQRVERLRDLEELVASKTADSRFDAWIFGFFAVLALFVSSAGVYGLLAFLVRSQRREIGTRLALGADQSLVLALVLRRGLALCAIGFVVGVGAAAAVGRVVSARLFGIHPFDLATCAEVGVALLVVGFAASYLPARFAANVDPAVALRSE